MNYISPGGRGTMISRCVNALLLILVVSALSFAADLHFDAKQTSFTFADTDIDKSTGLRYAVVAPKLPITIETTVTIIDPWAPKDVDTLWLAGLSESGIDVRPTVGIAWAEASDGWLSMWKLLLHMGDGTVRDLATVTPRAGNAYNTVMSYDPNTGFINWVVTDVGRGTIVTEGGAIVAPGITGLAAAGGVAVKPDKSVGVSVVAMNAYEVYIPVASNVQLVSGADGRVPLAKFNRDDDVWVRLQTPGGPPSGTYTLRFVEQDTGRVVEMDPMTASGTETRVQLPLQQLGSGRITWQFAYNDGSRTWMTVERHLTVGHMHIAYEQMHLDREVNRVTAVARLQSDGPIVDLAASIDAVFSRRVWDDKARTYYSTDETTAVVYADSLTIEDDEIVIPITASVPALDTPGLWEVAFHFRHALSIDTEQSGATHLFTNYAPANPADDNKPYIVALLPDTQNYSRHYPEIFLRQTEWLAANAEAMNIRLMLHLGDITDLNTPLEWERANAAISLLDGVMPYVLAVGNHDMKSTTGPVKNRHDTLFNDYFPVSRYDHMDAFGGVFEEGRHENSYYVFQLGGERVMVVSLEFGPRDEVLEWANDVVAAHSDYKVIVITHAYTANNGSRVTPSTSSGSPQAYPLGQDPAQTANDGQAIWNKFVRKHDNIQFVFSGHIQADTLRGQMVLGDNLNPIFEIVTNYQYEEFGGNGWLTLVEVMEGDQVQIRVYSPYWGMYETERKTRGFTNDATIDLQRGWLLFR